MTRTSAKNKEEMIRRIEEDAANVLSYMAFNGLVANASKTSLVVLNLCKKQDEIVIPNTIILGDFNLDINKKHLEMYSRKNYFILMQNILGHHGFDQLVNGDTWSRVVNGTVQSSRIDHVYTTVRSRISNHISVGLR